MSSGGGGGEEAAGEEADEAAASAEVAREGGAADDDENDNDAEEDGSEEDDAEEDEEEEDGEDSEEEEEDADPDEKVHTLHLQLGEGDDQEDLVEAVGNVVFDFLGPAEFERQWPDGHDGLAAALLRALDNAGEDLTTVDIVHGLTRDRAEELTELLLEWVPGYRVDRAAAQRVARRSGDESPAHRRGAGGRGDNAGREGAASGDGRDRSPAAARDGAESAKAPEAEASQLTPLRPQHIPTVSAWLTAGAKDLKKGSGKLYYEVTLGEEFKWPQIGWLTENFVEQDYDGIGVGDDRHGWAADGQRHKVWHDGDRDAQWPRDWVPGDVIGCAVDFTAGKMCFALNGEWVEAAAMDFNAEGYPLFPAISVSGNFVMHIPKSTWKHNAPSDDYDSWAEAGVFTRPEVATPPEAVQQRNEQIHSVYVAIPAGFEGLPIEMIFDDHVQARIYDIARRCVSGDIFRRLWPSGRRSMLDALVRGLEERGRGAVAHGLQYRQAEALVAQLTEVVTAEIAVDREAAARLVEATQAASEGAGDGNNPADSDRNARVHSLYCVLPADMQSMLDFVLPEILPRITSHRREFALSWPQGPAEMERALRHGIEEFGRGPLLHGLRLSQAEVLQQQLGELIEVEAVVDHEAAARVQEREKRSRPPPRPPPQALLSRLAPGSRVRIGPGLRGEKGKGDGKTEAERLQRGFGGFEKEAQACLGKEGTVVAYTPVEAGAQWAIRVTCKLESEELAVFDWNPLNVHALDMEAPLESDTGTPTGGDEEADVFRSLAGAWTMVDCDTGRKFFYEWQHTAGNSTFTGTQLGGQEVTDTCVEGSSIRWQIEGIRCVGRIVDGGRAIADGRYATVEGEEKGRFTGRRRDEEVLLANDDDLAVGDNVLYHGDGRWNVGCVEAVAEGDGGAFNIQGAMGELAVNVPKQHVQLVVVLEIRPEPLQAGTVVQITENYVQARLLQRSKWTEGESERCLGQRGVIVEVCDKRRVVVRCPAAAGPTTWNVGCLKVDKTEGLRCLDLHTRPLWWCSNLQGGRSCKADGCSKTNLEEAFCCLRAGSGDEGCALCLDCSKPYAARAAASALRMRSRHHLLPLTPVALPRGVAKSYWSCIGALAPGGCRGVKASKAAGDSNGAAAPEPARGGAICTQSEVLLCDACMEDETLGEPTPETRRQDVAELPASVPRIAASLRCRPSEIFALQEEAGLFEALARCLRKAAESASSRSSKAAAVGGEEENGDADASPRPIPPHLAIFEAAAAGQQSDSAPSENAEEAAVRTLALDIGTWLSAQVAAVTPEHVTAGPTLVETDEPGVWAEALVLAEEAVSFDGSWTDESDPDRRVYTIKNGMLYTPKPADSKASQAFEVSGCGVPDFNGKYMVDGTRDDKRHYKRLGNEAHTCFYEGKRWVLGVSYSGCWYFAEGDAKQPPTSGWELGPQGSAPAPKLSYGGSSSSRQKFSQLPSVGTWLMTPPPGSAPKEEEKAGEGQEEPQQQQSVPSDLDGVWRCEAAGSHHNNCMVIAGNRLAWSDGTSTELNYTGDGMVTMELQGRSYEGSACWDSEGHLLLSWCDGDIWLRCSSNAVLLDDQPEEGQPVDYKNFSGCYIKQVLPGGKALIHVPGIGDREAAPDAYKVRSSSAGLKMKQPATLERLSRDALCVELEDYAANLSASTQCAQLSHDGRLVWASRSSAWIRMENCRRCPGGHALKRSSAGGSGDRWACGSCGEQAVRRKRLRCRPCDYNICDNCIALRSWEGESTTSSSSTAPPPKTTSSSSASSGSLGSRGREDDAEVCLANAAEWSPCTVLGDGSNEGAKEVQFPPHLQDGEKRSMPAWRLRQRGLPLTTGPVDSLWLYENPTGNAIGIRYRPDIGGPHSGQVEHGELVRVCEHFRGANGVTFLRLADGRGWIFDVKPDVGRMCMLMRSRKEASGCSGEAAGSGICKVAWADATRPCEWVRQKRIRPPFMASEHGGRPDAAEALLKADLLKQLRLGPKCSRRDVQGLLQRRASVLSVPGGEDVLSVALKSGCEASVVEALLAANAPAERPGAPPPQPSAEGGEDAAGGEREEEKRLPELDPLKAIIAMREPRLAGLLALRGGSTAEYVAEAVETEWLCEQAGGSTSSTSGPQTPKEADDADAWKATVRNCAAAARRLASARARGSTGKLLCQFGKELLTPLALLDRNQALVADSWLDKYLCALLDAGYELDRGEMHLLVSAISARLVQECEDVLADACSFLKSLVDMHCADGRKPEQMRMLCGVLERHGVLLCLERFSGSEENSLMDDTGIFQAEAGELLRQIRSYEPLPDAEDGVAEVVAGLPELPALKRLVRMLRTGECTPYDLWVHDVPAKILPIFQAHDEHWPWSSAMAAPLDAPALHCLVSCLQTLLSMWETFPVAALGVRGEGLDCLLQPHRLVLEGSGWKKELSVEPLLPLSDLERFVLQTTPVTNKGYLEWCEGVCGERIATRADATGSWRSAVVVAFSNVSRLPVHTLQYDADGSEEQVLLHLRQVVVLSASEECFAWRKSGQARAAWRSMVSQLLLYTPQSNVEAKFEDGRWCRARIARLNSDGTFTVTWLNGTKKDTVKSVGDMRPVQKKSICQRVKITQANDVVSGVAVWEHASGALDVVDQEGRFLSAVGADRVIHEAQHAQDSPGRPVPLEIRNIFMPGHSSNMSAGPAPQLERNFSAVDRNRPQLGAVPFRRIGGPEGVPLRRPGPGDKSPSQLALDLEAEAGKAAPRLQVKFCRQPSRPPKTGSEKKAGNAGDAEDPAGDASCPGSPCSESKGSLLPDSPGQDVASQKEGSEPASAEGRDEEAETGQPLQRWSTVLQALLEPSSGRCAEFSERSCLRCAIEVLEVDDASQKSQTCSPVSLCRMGSGTERANEAGATGISAAVLALLRRLRAQLQGTRFETQPVWQNSPLNRKLEDQLAQPLLTAGLATPSWVQALPIAYPFLFRRLLREQLLHCAGFGTSHAVLWLQRQSIQEAYGDRLRRVEGQSENHMNLTDDIVQDRRVFIGPARSDVVTLPSRADLINNAERIMELTYTSKAVLEVKFADEGGFGDGVTQSFYTAVATTLALTETGRPRCGTLELWAEHGEDGVIQFQGKGLLHARRGLFPRPYKPRSSESEAVCRHFRFLGRLVAKALRDGFVVPLPLCPYFFAAVLGEELPLGALPKSGDGHAGEFVGAAAAFAADLRSKYRHLEAAAKAEACASEAQAPGWSKKYLADRNTATEDWSFNQYVDCCGITFCEFGAGGRELCEGGENKRVTIDALEDFVAQAAEWWLRDGIAAQAAAFRLGVEDVSESSTCIWAFEPAEFVNLFCGGQVEWTRKELEQHMRWVNREARGDMEKAEKDMLLDALERMSAAQRGQFMEFVTACPRLPPGGLAALQPKVTIVASNQPVGSLPRARTCVNELHVPRYASLEQLEDRLRWAVENAEGLYDDNRMGWMA
eukprot:TRINITY_DN51396_c0_g1_i1.p1 TRINITY_DN51396_c0_g1~~TRINITY_DN51396_c0_g1_i1.p1  ORF type:complete len:3437 (-),score=883.73 TRINITY_DN51396_c0_g1_i1:237-10547(-)